MKTADLVTLVPMNQIWQALKVCQTPSSNCLHKDYASSQNLCFEVSIHWKFTVLSLSEVYMHILRPSAFYGGFGLGHISVSVTAMTQTAVCSVCVLQLSPTTQPAETGTTGEELNQELSTSVFLNAINPFWSQWKDTRVLIASLLINHWYLQLSKPLKCIHNLKNGNCLTDVNMSKCARQGLQPIQTESWVFDE